jgi:hypothetical protein
MKVMYMSETSITHVTKMFCSVQLITLVMEREFVYEYRFCFNIGHGLCNMSRLDSCNIYRLNVEGPL